MTVEERLREAIADHVERVPAPPDGWEDIETRAARVRRRGRLWTGGAAGLTLVAAGLLAFLVVPGASHKPARRLVTSPPASTAVPSTAVPTTSVPATTLRPQVSTSAPAPAPAASGYTLLWPFRSQAEAATWQRDAASAGHQPWHLDADQTALAFTQGFLGFNEIDKVVAHTTGQRDARVSVGFATTGSQTSTAAVIHLVRMGTGADGPWEVVGTDDTTLTIANPRYGATVKSPMAVAGTITGVDENIHVEVRQPSSADPIGVACCLPAGGDASPWATKVAFSGAKDPALTVVAWTGGHFQRVEVFAVTGVRPAA